MAGNPGVFPRALTSTALVVIMLTATVTPALAAKAARPQPPSWPLEAVRFEPLDEAAGLAVDDVGSYRGAIEIRRTPSGVAVVNDIDFDTYLYGISEVPVSWPIEAQKAQAIAARTYALHQLQRARSEVIEAAAADICATEACQVYAGLAKEQRDGFARWRAAVDSTSGKVLLHRGAPINAKYSSTNGGTSVPGGQPYLRAVADPDDATSPWHRWRADLPMSTVTSVFATAQPVTGAHRRGDEVALTWPGGELVVPVADFRARVNEAVPAPDRRMTLMSARFDVLVAGDTVVVSGRGYGHGIGMSQYGALGKAQRGWKADQILAAYYGGIRPTDLGDDALPDRLDVAVDLGRGSAVVNGRFRVLDASGAVVAPVAEGPWRVVPAPGGVRVLPPIGYGRPFTVEQATVEPGVPSPGMPVEVRIQLPVPAVVRVTAQPPDGLPVTMAPAVAHAGEVRTVLPPANGPGDYTVMIEADAGTGRTLQHPISFRVHGPSADELPPAAAFAAPLAAAGSGPGPGGVGLASAGLLGLAVVAGWQRRRRDPLD